MPTKTSGPNQERLDRVVAQAQRDLLSAQINEIQAVVGYLKALVELRRLEGSLLLYRGIVSPGKTPVAMNERK